MASLAASIRQHDQHDHRAGPAAGVRVCRRVLTATVLLGAFLLLLADAMVHPVAFFDVRLMRAVQRFDVPATYPVLHTVRTLTGSEGAIVAWVVVGLVLLARRWWAPAVALGLLPIGGVVNEGINLFLVERSRPHLETLARSSLDPEEHSFPSGHVTGAVLLCGLILAVSGRFRLVPVRLAVRALGVSVVGTIGFQRVWGGAHWPTDVLAAHALGGVLLIALVSLAEWLDPELDGRSPPDAVGRLAALALSPVRVVAGGRSRPAVAPASSPEPLADARSSAAAWYLAHHRDGSSGPPSPAARVRRRRRRVLRTPLPSGRRMCLARAMPSSMLCVAVRPAVRRRPRSPGSGSVGPTVVVSQGVVVNRLPRIWASLTLTLTLVIAMVAMPSRGGAQGDAAVATPQSIAHGVATLPDEPVAWRVVSSRAGGRDAATAGTGSLGFTLAGDGALLVENPATGTQDVLASGAAAFVPDGADQVVSALDGTATYDAVALVPATAATDAGDGTLVLGGDGFASPGGNRALDLSRVVLAPGQTVTSPAPDSPTPALVLVTQGAVDVDYAGETITLSAGQAAVLDGELALAASTGAAVAIATIGADVPEIDAAGPVASGAATAVPSTAVPSTAVPSTGATPTAGTGSGDSGDGISGGGDDAGAGALDISVLDCSGGTLLDTTSCAPLAGVTVTLVIDGVQAAYVSGDGGALPGIDVPAGSSVTISDVSGGPEGLQLLNVPFAIPAFDGDIVVPIVFDAPAEGPVATGPADPTGATPVTGEPAGPVVSTLTIQALDCRDGDLATLEGCVAMPNATFSVTRGPETQPVETGFTTDANGVATFAAEDGAAVTATYAFGAPTGVAPNNDGQVLEPVAGDATLTFVFVDVNESNG